MSEKYTVRLDKDDIELILDLCSIINDHGLLAGVHYNTLISIKKRFEAILVENTPKIPYVEK